MAIYTTSSSLTATQIVGDTGGETHTILPGVVLESTSDPVATISNASVTLNIGGYAISSSIHYAIILQNGSSRSTINILESGYLFGGGILLGAAIDTSVYFVNAGQAFGQDVGYGGSVGVDKIVNSGSISVLDSAFAATTNGGDDQVFNSGVFQGHINLGSDDDLYSGTGNGVVNGTVFGDSGNDTLRGSDEGDSFDGGTESDLINGRGGDDTLMGNTGADTIFGGDGNDIIDGEVNNDIVNGNAGDDTIMGSGGDDTLRGGRDDDEIRGGTGDDNMRGDSGDDLMVGGDGRDDMFGGSGNDVFLFEDTNDSGLGAVRDRIYDFKSGEDTIDISQLVGGVISYIGSSSFSGTGGREVRAVNLSNGTLIYIDTNGDGARDSDIYLIGTDSVTEGDFLL